MTLVRHNGVTLPGPGFHPSQLAGRSPKAMREQEIKDAILAVMPRQWAFPASILRLAKVEPNKTSYRVIRDLASVKLIERRVFECGASTQTKYRRKP